MKNNLTNIKSDNINKIDWKLLQNEMKNKFGSEIYDSWLKKIDLVDEFKSYVLLSVSTRFIRDWITSRYLDQILQIIKLYKKDISRIEFVINENIKNKNTDEIKPDNSSDNEKVSFIKDSYLQYNRIDPNKNFENFLLGKSNKLAFEAAKKVSEQIAHYNPLYIYGGVGMGKTHLLNAIGLSLKEKNKVMFISAERFMYQFVKSIKSNDMVKFKEYFRNTDIFLIDDIQFMNGKEAMQEEFFHTFNVLLEKGSQIIVSADRPPNKLTRIQERIKSRFSGGLVVDIQNADFELRYNIIKSKNDDLKIHDPNNIKICDEIIKFINNLIDKDNEFDKKKALNALSSTSFSNLKKIENTKGFSEALDSKIKNERIPFFHLGPENNWKNKLDKNFQIKVNEVFKKNLEELHYL